MAEVLALVVYVFGGTGLVGLAAYGLVRLDRRCGRRPHRVDKPVQNGALPPAWGTWEAALERVPASVRAEFLPVPTLGELLSDDGWPPAAGVLLVPDDVEVMDLGHGPSMIRASRDAVGRIRFSSGGPVPEPTVGPSGPSGVSSAHRAPCGAAACTRDHGTRWPPGMPHEGPPGGSGQAKAAPAGRETWAERISREQQHRLRTQMQADAARVAAEARRLAPREGPRRFPLAAEPERR